MKSKKQWRVTHEINCARELCATCAMFTQTDAAWRYASLRNMGWRYIRGRGWMCFKHERLYTSRGTRRKTS